MRGEKGIEPFHPRRVAIIKDVAAVGTGPPQLSTLGRSGFYGDKFRFNPTFKLLRHEVRDQGIEPRQPKQVVYSHP